MPRRRVFVPPECIQGDSAVLPEDQQHYLKHVLRLRPGDPLEIFDGEGRSWSGRVGRVGNSPAAVTLVPVESPADPIPAICLALALIKPDRFEWALEKGTELGVREIVPLETRYTSVRIPPERLDSRLERWRRVVREASRQSGRSCAPVVHAPLPLEEFLVLPGRADSIKLYFHEHEGDPWDGTVPANRDVALVIGPEGGWHADENEAAVRAGCSRVHLGGWTLRAETAAVAAVSVVRFAIRRSRAC
jgi:16S rRNA (uracil1498-N3)-methyltransferase